VTAGPAAPEPAARPASGLVPYGLQCEYRSAPLGMGERWPRLSWRLRSGLRGDRPTAHRITVTRLAPSGAAAETCWDPGWRAGDEPGAAYAGAPLESGTRYAWQVQVRDAAGEPGEPAGSWFETGLLSRADWQAAWIGRDPESAGPADPPTDDDILGDGLLGHLNRRLPPCAHLRRSFELPDRPVRGRLYVTARGLYEARLNGVRVGDHELAPGWTDYRARIQYQAYDVTGLMVPGENVLGAILGDGWFSGRVGPGARKLGEHYGPAAQLLAQLQLDWPDGSRQLVVSDGRWRACAGPLRFSDLLAGELYDARRELGDWSAPGYDAGAWSPVLDGGRDPELLVADSDEPVRGTGELSPAAIEPRPGGVQLADLGQNMVGRVRLTIRGAAAGDRIVVRHGEALTAEGDLYTANLRLAAATDVYIAAGRPVEVFEPRFTCHGFRCVTVSGYPGPLDPADLAGVVLHSDVPRAGRLRTSDETVNQLLSNIRWGQRGNFVSIPTDCPQRDERLGWLADAQVFLPTACYQADVAAFFARWMRDVVSSRLPGGAFPDVAPRVVFERDGAPGWGDAGVIIPWQLWRTYGDRRVLESSFEAMAGWVEHVRRHNPDLIWRNRVGNHYGDWLQVDARTPREVLATAYFARSTDLLARAAGVLGREADARQYGELAAAIRAAFGARFVAPDGRVTGATQTGYLLALAFGLLPGDLAAAAAGHLAADIEARGGRLTTGFLGVALLCPVLTAHGRADLAYALLHQDAYPSWNYSIRHGATTIWERWDGWTPERGFQSVAMNSLNHYSLGSVGEWLYRSVGGIGQAEDSVGYRHLDLAPVPGGRLTWAQASYESARGLVEVSWRAAGGRLTLAAAVPPGATASIRVPTSDPESVREGGRAVADVPDVTVTAREAGVVVCRVGSGRYEFEAER
jgi:alpha-L-rhamnosidase